LFNVHSRVAKNTKIFETLDVFAGILALSQIVTVWTDSEEGCTEAELKQEIVDGKNIFDRVLITVDFAFYAGFVASGIGFLFMQSVKDLTMDTMNSYRGFVGR